MIARNPTPPIHTFPNSIELPYDWKSRHAIYWGSKSGGSPTMASQRIATVGIRRSFAFCNWTQSSSTSSLEIRCASSTVARTIPIIFSNCVLQFPGVFLFIYSSNSASGGKSRSDGVVRFLSSYSDFILQVKSSKCFSEEMSLRPLGECPDWGLRCKRWTYSFNPTFFSIDWLFLTFQHPTPKLSTLDFALYCIAV